MTGQPRRNISSDRKTLYYAGNVVTAVGVLLFLSTFLGVLCIMASPPAFDHMGSRAAWTFGRGFIGFVLIIAGRFMASVGKRGMAGSGLILDPEQQREDLEPWNRMHGGMTNDMLSEVEPVQKIANGLGALAGERDSDGNPVHVVKVRCRNCRTLNDEDAKFCDQCGQAM